jgi:hypothetical protein
MSKGSRWSLPILDHVHVQRLQDVKERNLLRLKRSDGEGNLFEFKKSFIVESNASKTIHDIQQVKMRVKQFGAL